MDTTQIPEAGDVGLETGGDLDANNVSMVDTISADVTLGEEKSEVPG
jgi:hypothetical protein